MPSVEMSKETSSNPGAAALGGNSRSGVAPEQGLGTGPDQLRQGHPLPVRTGSMPSQQPMSWAPLTLMASTVAYVGTTLDLGLMPSAAMSLPVNTITGSRETPKGDAGSFHRRPQSYPPVPRSS